MKLSIVTISYNNLEGLKKTTESVFSQTWNDFEWIVIDGGSTDGTKEYLSSLNPQPNYWCCEKDNGIYDAQNKGIMLSKGEYVCCMNSGDTFSDALTLENVFKNNIEADIVYGDWKRISVKGNEIVYSPKEMPKFFFFYDNICHQAMFVKTKLLQESPFDLSYKVYADWAKWRQLMYAGCDFQYVPVTICDFEADSGISQVNNSLCETEYNRLQSAMPVEVFRYIYNEAIAKGVGLDAGLYREIVENEKYKKKYKKHQSVIRTLLVLAGVELAIILLLLFMMFLDY